MLHQCNYSNFTEVIRKHADETPDKKYFTFLGDNGQEIEQCSFLKLHEKAKNIAGFLNAHSKPGDRVLLLYSQGPEYIYALMGCLYAGTIAVPTYPPISSNAANRIKHIIEDSLPVIGLSDSTISSLIQSKQNSNKSNLYNIDSISSKNSANEYLTGKYLNTLLVDTEKLDDKWANNYNPIVLNHKNLAFLQYTSGSTGNPKGVMVTHGNLLNNEEIIKCTYKHSKKSVGVGWLPFYHDMGLVGNILQPCYVGFPIIFMSPKQFIRNPLSWLDTITRYKATTSGGPIFAYDLCIRRVTSKRIEKLDLSSWDIAFCGAEPIRPTTLRQFAEIFQTCGFRKESFINGYGMAESTLLLTQGDKFAEPAKINIQREALNENRVVECTDTLDTYQTLIGCGQKSNEHRIEIVDPEQFELINNSTIGEIWVKGPSVAAGYWNKPDLTKEIFKAYLDNGEGPFLRTGDLGFINNKELFITGRLKDVIIIDGRNHYSEDIEITVENCHPNIRPRRIAAFAIIDDLEEKLCIAAECKGKKENTTKIINNIRYAISRDHGLKTSSITLIKPKTIPITTNGKIRRLATKNAFLAGELNIIDYSNILDAPYLDEGKKDDTSLGGTQDITIENSNLDQFVNIVAEKLKINPQDIDINAPLGQFGLSSRDALELSLEVEILTGEEFPPTLIYEHPTIQMLFDHINELTSGNKAKEVQQDYSEELVAITGISCNFPGSEDANTYWQNLKNGENLITQIPDDRPGLKIIKTDDLETLESSSNQWGGFIDGIKEFDADFFGISPSEAITMDPQHRIFLQTAWKAIEDSGYAPSSLSGGNIGVFAGISTSDYSEFIIENSTSSSVYAATGIAHSLLSNRLSYILDIHGPSENIDTACSSSLVAVNRAVQAICNKECDQAIAGGVNALLATTNFDLITKAGFLSKDGKCKTFDESANGYVRGEGAGVIFLKPVHKAIEDGDYIYAVIKGTSVNHGGRTVSLTAPNENAQAALIVNAFENAGITSDTITYIEAHGTGTVLGDPIEVNSLKKAFRKQSSENTKQDNYCGLGSVKTNIGHLEAASGIAGLIKVVLALKNRKLPASINFKKLNPYINLNGSPFYIVKKTKKWENLTNKDGNIIPLRAGISSFGYGGSNAHVVVEEYDNQMRLMEDFSEPHVVLLSAKTANALQRYIHALHNFLLNDDDQTGKGDILLSDIAYTLQTGRDHFSERIAFIADSKLELKKILKNLISEKQDSSRIFIGNSVRIKSENSHKMAQLLEEKNLEKLAQLWIEGFEIDWYQLHDKVACRKVSLPTYQFEKKYYWIQEAKPQEGIVETVEEENNTIAVIPLPITLEEAVEWLKNTVSEYTSIPISDIAIGENFDEVGLDSIALIDIFAIIKDDLRIELPETAIQDCPNINSLAKFMVDGEINELFDLEKEAILEEGVLPKNLKETYKHQQNDFGKHILLTGATGFFGIFLLRELVKSTEATIYCLVRAQDNESGIKRLRDAIKKFRITDCSINKRVKILTGDLTEEKFGIELETYEKFSQLIDTVYHCGGIVDWMKPYASLKKANVSGTIEVIKFAGHKTIKHLHYISSLAVLPLIEGKYQWFETDIPKPNNLTNGYAKSKCVAEKLCMEARHRGLPVNIYRFDFVVGPDKTGAMKETDFIIRLIKGCIQLGCIPAEDTNFDIVSVDYLSKVVIEISKLNNNETYHLINRKPFSTSDFASLIRGFGYKLEKITFETWKKLVEKNPSNVLYPLYPFIKLYTTEQLEHYHRSIIDNTNTLTALYEIDPELISGAPSAGYIMRKAIGFFQKQGYLSAANHEGVIKRQAKYWQSQLSGAPMRLELPKEKWVNQNSIQHIATESFDISKKIFEKIENLSNQEGVSFSETLLSIFKIFLFRYCCQTDIPVAVPIAHRVSLEMNKKNGYITKIPIIRTLLPENASFRSVLSEVKQIVSEAYANMDFPSDELCNMIYSKTDPNDSTKYDCMFVFQDEICSLEEKDRLSIAPLSLNDIWPEYDGILLHFEKSQEKLTGSFKYCSHLFSNNTITRMIRHFNKLLKEVVTALDVNVFKVPIMGEEELNQILYEWNETQADYPSNKCVHELFTIQAQKTPAAIAVSFEGKYMTYQELDQKSDQLAVYLKKHGAGSGDMVGVCIERSFEMIIGLLGILKTGAAYVPLDPSYPKDRLKYMMEDSDAKIILTQSTLTTNGLSKFKTEKIYLDKKWNSIFGKKHEDYDIEQDGNFSSANISYMIYTSGSTGKPKGVKIFHRSLTNLLHAMDSHLSLSSKDSFLSITSLSFDIAALEIFLPLIKGARIELLPPVITNDGSGLKSFLESTDISYMQATPATWQILKYAGWQGNPSTTLICGGEALSDDLAKNLINWGKTAYNVYGPTETTIWSTIQKLQKANPVNIGNPIANTKLYILDDYLNPVPVGVAGELYIGGEGLFKDYHNKPKLTSIRFIPNPFDKKNSSKIYKTGDLVRYLPSGEIDYLGRMDNQVKVRGYRIELEGIETVLNQDEQIRECIVIVRHDRKNDKQIVAYIVPIKKVKAVSISKIHNRMKEVLPLFMVPSDYVVLEKFPLTPNGKVDRKALPKPKGHQLINEYIPPSTSVAIQLSQIWHSILDVDKVGIKDHFLEIGGDSVKATELLVRINEELGVNLTIQNLFENLTIAELSETIIYIHNNGCHPDYLASALPDLNSEVVLDLSIDTNLLKESSITINNPSNIFLTGATGFLGAYLLQNLLKKTSADVYCLVRADNIAHGIKRIKKNLKTYILWEDSFNTRIKPVLGDLSLPQLGISSEIYHYLEKNMDVIYHNGSVVNFSYPYKFLKKPNVNGTVEILKLASQKKIKPLFYISSTIVFESSKFSQGQLIHETDDLPNPEGLFYGYSQSKWVAEKIVTHANEKGLPISIFRPSTVLGDSKTGVSNLDDMYNYFIRAIVTSGAIPDLDLELNGVPVDFVAHAIVNISLNPKAIGEKFNITTPYPISTKWIIEYFISSGYNLPLLPFEIWVEILEDAVKDDKYLLPLMPVIKNEVSLITGKTYLEMQAESTPTYSFENTQKFLSTYDRLCPPLANKLWHKYLAYLEDINFISRPSKKLAHGAKINE